MMPNSEEMSLLLEDWKVTRGEMLQLVKVRYELFAATLAAQGVMNGLMFIVVEKAPELVLIVVVLHATILAASVMNYLGLSRHYHWLASYLGICVEPDLKMDRERRFGEFIARRRPPDSFSQASAWAYMLMWSAGAVLPAWLALRLSSIAAIGETLVLALTLTLTVFFLTFVRKLLQIRRYKASCEQVWREVRELRTKVATPTVR